MSKYRVTEESFLADVAQHRMTLITDDGVCRHVRFSQPNSSNQYFDLITWPGHLCYTGDMGAFVFSRLNDMFEFFRTKPSRFDEGRSLYINLGYWAEKLIAVSSNGRFIEGVREYDPEIFERIVKQQLVEWRHGLTLEQWQDLRQAVQNDVLDRAEDGEDAAHIAARDFKHERFEFSDFWEHDLTEYTTRFVWCCYALSWGIQQYDAQYAIAA